MYNFFFFYYNGNPSSMHKVFSWAAVAQEVEQVVYQSEAG